jgi:hypothetical protein
VRFGRLLRNAANSVEGALHGIDHAALMGAAAGSITAAYAGSDTTEGMELGALAGGAMGLAGLARSKFAKRAAMSGIKNEMKANRMSMAGNGLIDRIKNSNLRSSRMGMAQEYRSVRNSRLGIGATGYVGGALAGAGLSFAMLPSNRVTGSRRG